jgi:hypothetical protein
VALALGRAHRPEHLHILEHPPDGPLDVAERQGVAQVDRRQLRQLDAPEAAVQLINPGGEVVGGHGAIVADVPMTTGLGHGWQNGLSARL